MCAERRSNIRRFVCRNFGDEFMNIIVVGCGKVGLALVEQLTKEGHNIAVVDKNANRLKSVLSNLDVMSYVGDGTSFTTLKNAGIESADLMVAVMDADEMNLLCCVIAQKVGHCRTIARVRNPIYSPEIEFLKKELDISMIFNPEMAAAEEISRIFNFPSAVAIDVFSNRRVEMVHFKIKFDSKFSNLKVADIRAKYHCQVLVCTVTRGDKVMIPGGDFVLEEGDEVGVVGARPDITDFFRMFGVGTKKIPDAMVVGGGKIGYYLAKNLLESGIRVKIIEVNMDRCNFLAEKLPDADIINGDGTDRNLLMEEGLANASGFAALTSLDEENILLSLYAKPRVLSKTVTKINRINYEEVIDQLDLDIIVNPNTISTELIVQFARSMEYTQDSNIENYRRIGDGGAEAMEFVVKDSSEVVGIPLIDLHRKKDVLIACINRNNKIIIPAGSDSIEIGDRVIVVHTTSDINNIDDILE